MPVASIVLRRIGVFILSVVLVVTIVYVLNFWWWNYAAPKAYLARVWLTQDDALFLEGLALVLLGVLFLLGSGGINMWSIRASVLGSAADAIYGGKGHKAPGPSEILKRDLWKASGFVRFGLTLLLAGIVLIVLHFLL